MSIVKSLSAGIGAVALVSLTAIPAQAGPSEALAACKSEIAADARMSQFDSVRQNTGAIKRRGRYTSFEIKVSAAATDGTESTWEANCKARSNGKVEELELVQVGGTAGTQVAQSDN